MTPPRTRGKWAAGPITPCEYGADHRVASVHVVVRCACGAAFISTDATIALGMAQEHDRNHPPGTPTETPHCAGRAAAPHARTPMVEGGCPVCGETVTVAGS